MELSVGKLFTKKTAQLEISPDKEGSISVFRWAEKCNVLS
jgi:hypothetical protein